MKFIPADEIPYPDDFPLKEFLVNPSRQEKAQKDAVHQLLDKGANETLVDNYLREHPELLGACMNFTQFGHHGTWVIPQQTVRPPLAPQQKGLKPDYVIGGKGSDGSRWYVIELKGVITPLFVEKKSGRISLSGEANEGLMQLVSYIDYCGKAQAFLRDSLHLVDFSEPQGFLIIGRQSELLSSQRKQQLRKALNHVLAGRIEVRTYDALVRSNGSSWTDRGDDTA